MSLPRVPLIPKPNGLTRVPLVRTRALQKYAHVKLPSVDDLHAERMRRSLAEFVKGAWKVIEPGRELIWNWHVFAICAHVEALVKGTLGKRNLIINVPPGSMKSTIVSVCT